MKILLSCLTVTMMCINFNVHAQTENTLRSHDLTSREIVGKSIMNVPSFQLNGEESQTTHPVGIGPRRVQSSVLFDTTATKSGQSEWPYIIQMHSSTGEGKTDPAWGGEADRITLFTGADCRAGSSSCWAQNHMVYLGPGFASGAHGIEVDMENSSSDRDPHIAGTKVVNGIEITGDSKYPISYGIDIVPGPVNTPYLTHTAIGILPGAAKDEDFLEAGTASTAIMLEGTHEEGLNLSSMTLQNKGSAILLNAGHSIDFYNSHTKKTVHGLNTDGESIIVGANSPTVNIGSSEYNQSENSFLNISNNKINEVVLSAKGKKEDVDINLSAKGNGKIISHSELNAPSIIGSTIMAGERLQVPVTTAKPIGHCTPDGLLEVSKVGIHSCIDGEWKTAKFQ